MVTGGTRYLLLNTLTRPVLPPLSRAGAAYTALAEVVITMIEQSDGVLEEGLLFTCLRKLGLDRSGTLPDHAPAHEKVEAIVQKRLTNDAFIKRRKKPNEPDAHEYTIGNRVAGVRSREAAVQFRADLLDMNA